MVSLHEGDRGKKIAVKREGQRERETLTDGIGFLCITETEKKISSEQRETKGKRDPDRPRKICFFS